MQNEELQRKEKLIADQQAIIDTLKGKMENLEESFDMNKSDLEKRLNDTEADLQQKIEQFEKNLHEGRKYFEEILEEKDELLREKQNEINELNARLNQEADEKLRSDSEVVQLLKREIDEKNALIESIKQQHQAEISELMRVNTSDEFSRSMQSKLNDLSIDLEIKKASIAKLKEDLETKQLILTDKEKVIITLRNQLAISEAKVNDAHSSEITAKKIKEQYEADLRHFKQINEHQVGVLKSKIDMLEKTISNYHTGLSSLNKSSDEISQLDTSQHVYKGIIDELQKLNVQLETDKIESDVKIKNLNETIANLEREKENLNKRFVKYQNFR